MLKVFVCIPHEYYLPQESAIAHREQLEQIALRAAISLNKYVELIENVDTLTECEREDVNFYKMRYIRDCISLLARADYVVFADNWQTSEECRLIRAIAEFCNIKILEL